MAGKYEIHPLEKKFILDTTGVDIDAPAPIRAEDPITLTLTRDQLMRLRQWGLVYHSESYDDATDKALYLTLCQL